MIPNVYIEKPWLVLACCVIAYFLGSLSFGLIVADKANGPDLRKVGSGNTGASNVQRTMGWKYGLITFAGDASKGILACLIAELITGDHMASMAAGLCAIIGHNWPVYYGFRGGKGVAASCGVLLYCFWWQALICFVLTIALIAAVRYISLGSMFLLTSYAVLVSLTYTGESRLFVIIWAVILSLICIIRHHGNIVRLLQGKENKLQKKQVASEDKFHG